MAVTGQLMVVIDITVVNVATVTIRSVLGFSAPGVRWVASGYTLAFAGFLLVGGRAADKIGRRRIFALGLGRPHRRGHRPAVPTGRPGHGHGLAPRAIGHALATGHQLMACCSDRGERKVFVARLADWARRWLVVVEPYSVRLASPHAPDECVRRLREATVTRRPGGPGDPRLRGDVGAERIRVTRRARVSRRRGLTPWLLGRLESGAGGGAVLIAEIGPSGEDRAACGVAVAIGLVWLGVAESSVASAAHPKALLLLLIPSLWLALLGLMIAGLRGRYRREIPALVRDLAEILDPAPVSGLAPPGLPSAP